VREHLVVDLAGERREARVVVVQARVVRGPLEPTAYRRRSVGVALLAVGIHRLVLDRPRLAPVHRLIRPTDRAAEGEDGCVAGRLALQLGRDRHERPGGRFERLAVDLERRGAVEHDVHLFLAAGLVVLVDQHPVLADRAGIDPERVNPEVLAHRDEIAALLHLVEARHAPLCLVVHSLTLRVRIVSPV
jgi:hypothetical protein